MHLLGAYLNSAKRHFFGTAGVLDHSDLEPIVRRRTCGGINAHLAHRAAYGDSFDPGLVQKIQQTGVMETVGTRFRNTVILGATASILGVPLAIFLGIIAALWRDRLPDLWVSTAAIFAMTIPEFVSSTVLILIFSVWLGWLPGIVITRPDAPLFEFLSDIILPIVVLAFVMTAHILRMVRTSVIDVMASDYVQMAQLKGVPYWQMVFKHVLPNALLPTINLVALTIAWLLGGTLVIEVVFNYPGLGRLMLQAIFFRDLAVVQAIALILATLYVGLNLFADLLTLVANPRLRTMQTSRP